MGELSYRLKRFLYQEYIPVTKSIAVISGLSFLFSFIPPLRDILELLRLNSNIGFALPWTLATYPIVLRDIFSAIFGILWLWMIGGSLERSWGSRKYGLFFLTATVATGTAMSVVGFLQITDGRLVYGLWLPLLGVTWAWAELAPDQEMLFWGIIPMRARILAWINAAIVFLSYYSWDLGGLLYGIASISGIAVVYLFSGNGPFSGGYRYGTWRQGYSSGRTRDRLGKKAARKRFRVIK